MLGARSFIMTGHVLPGLQRTTGCVWRSRTGGASPRKHMLRKSYDHPRFFSNVTSLSLLKDNLSSPHSPITVQHYHHTYCSLAYCKTEERRHSGEVTTGLQGIVGDFKYTYLFLEGQIKWESFLPMSQAGRLLFINDLSHSYQGTC